MKCEPNELTELLDIDNMFGSVGGLILALNVVILVLFAYDKYQSRGSANSVEFKVNKFVVICAVLTLLSYVAMIVNFAASTASSLRAGG